MSRNDEFWRQKNYENVWQKGALHFRIIFYLIFGNLFESWDEEDYEGLGSVSLSASLQSRCLDNFTFQNVPKRALTKFLASTKKTVKQNRSKFLRSQCFPPTCLTWCNHQRENIFFLSFSIHFYVIFAFSYVLFRNIWIKYDYFHSLTSTHKTYIVSKLFIRQLRQYHI